jgi:hypothetical protein
MLEKPSLTQLRIFAAHPLLPRYPFDNYEHNNSRQSRRSNRSNPGRLIPGTFQLTQPVLVIRNLVNLRLNDSKFAIYTIQQFRVRWWFFVRHYETTLSVISLPQGPQITVSAISSKLRGISLLTQPAVLQVTIVIIRLRFPTAFEQQSS